MMTVTNKRLVEILTTAIEKPEIANALIQRVINTLNKQSEPEPVAWRFYDGDVWCYVDHLTDLPQNKFEPLYTAPPQEPQIKQRTGDCLLTGVCAAEGHRIQKAQRQQRTYTLRKWQGLTDDEILEEYRQSYGDDGDLTDVYFARAIESKLKEKNSG
jgi:hypothetical protein